MLRNEPPLLDTRIPALLMLIVRLFLLFSIGLITRHSSEAQTTSTEPVAEKSDKPAVSDEPRITFNFVHVNGAYIAMTFDDGPSVKLTPKLLELLAAHHIKATFFVIGQNVADHPEIVQPRLKVMKSEITVGRILTLLKCRMLPCVASCAELTMLSRMLPEGDQR